MEADSHWKILVFFVYKKRVKMLPSMLDSLEHIWAVIFCKMLMLTNPLQAILVVSVSQGFLLALHRFISASASLPGIQDFRVCPMSSELQQVQMKFFCDPLHTFMLIFCPGFLLHIFWQCLSCFFKTVTVTKVLKDLF